MLQFRLWQIIATTALIALILAPIASLQRSLHRSPHQRAMDSVNGRDGWAREETGGYVVADLNGGTCQIHDKSLQDLIDCKRLRKLTAYDTLLTDRGLQYLVCHRELKILHLDGCKGITDGAISYLAKLRQLEELSVTGTSITEDGLRRLRNALPDSRVNPRSHGLAKE